METVDALRARILADGPTHVRGNVVARLDIVAGLLADGHPSARAAALANIDAAAGLLTHAPELRAAVLDLRPRVSWALATRTERVEIRGAALAETYARTLPRVGAGQRMTAAGRPWPTGPLTQAEFSEIAIGTACAECRTKAEALRPESTYIDYHAGCSDGVHAIIRAKQAAWADEAQPAGLVDVVMMDAEGRARTERVPRSQLARIVSDPAALGLPEPVRVTADPITVMDALCRDRFGDAYDPAGAARMRDYHAEAEEGRGVHEEVPRVCAVCGVTTDLAVSRSTGGPLGACEAHVEAVNTGILNSETRVRSAPANSVDATGARTVTMRPGVEPAPPEPRGRRSQTGHTRCVHMPDGTWMEHSQPLGRAERYEPGDEFGVHVPLADFERAWERAEDETPRAKRMRHPDGTRTVVFPDGTEARDGAPLWPTGGRTTYRDSVGTLEPMHIDDFNDDWAAAEDA